MMKSYSNPYPHIIIDNFITKEMCEKLIQELNAAEKKFKVASVMGGRTRFNKENFTLNDEAFKLYEKFNNIKLFNSFFDNLIAETKNSEKKFYIDNFFNDIEFKKENNLFFKIKKKIFKPLLTNKVFLEMDYSIGRNGYNREPHHDAPNKIIVFLLYLNSFENKDEGGALEIYKYKEKFKDKFLQNPLNENLELQKKMYPQQGQLIIFLSCPNSIHGVEFYKPHDENKRYFVYGSYGSYYNLNWQNN